MPTQNPDSPDSPGGAATQITAALIERVSERLALGIPLRLALATEPVTRAEYKDHLLRHPELQKIQDIQKLKLLESAYQVMFDGENAAASYRWLIEHVYPEACSPSSEDEPAKKKPTIAGLPEDIIEQIRENAKRL